MISFLQTIFITVPPVFRNKHKNQLTNAIQENIFRNLRFINLVNPKHIIVLGTGIGIDKNF